MDCKLCTGANYEVAMELFFTVLPIMILLIFVTGLFFLLRYLGLIPKWNVYQNQN